MRAQVKRNKFSITGATRFLLAAAVLMLLSSPVQANDLLVIEKITCVKPAGGIDAFSKAGFRALSQIVEIGLYAGATFYAGPVTVGAIEVALAAGDLPGPADLYNDGLLSVD
jgi:hypothetical protein